MNAAKNALEISHGKYIHGSKVIKRNAVDKTKRCSDYQSNGEIMFNVKSL